MYDRYGSCRRHRATNCGSRDNHLTAPSRSPTYVKPDGCSGPDIQAAIGHGYFMLDQLISVDSGVGPTLAPAVERPLLCIVDAFSAAVVLFRLVTVTV